MVVILSSLGMVWIVDCCAQSVDRLFKAGESHRISKDLTVPFGKVWKIEAGSRLCFEASAAFIVDGVLVANGAPNQRITFTACESEQPWGGIRFVDSREIYSVRSRLQHVVIENASKIDKKTSFDPNTAGGGLFVLRSDLEVSNTVIRRNKAEIGGGVYIGHDSDVAIRQSAIYDNEAVGSNYIYAGGGGLYVASPRNLLVLNSIFALNRFNADNYSNEEGGGGIYVAQGRLDFALNLVIANSSGKGAGMLVLSQGSTPSHRKFTANIFAYNSGSFNFEQVALQTRYSYDSLHEVGEWSINVGQRPFVAHLNRNALSSYYFNGSKEFLEQLRPASTVNLRLLIEDKVSSVTLGELPDVHSGRKLCGNDIDFGPIELCPDDGDELLDYFSLVAEVFEPELGDMLKDSLSPADGDSLTGIQRKRLAKLIAPLSAPAPVDDRLVDLVFGDATQRDAAIDLIADYGEDAPKRGKMSALLMVKNLGLNKSFDELVEKSTLSITTLQNALQLRNEVVALSLLRDADLAKTLKEKELYDLLQRASYSNLLEVVEELLNQRVDPNLSLRERLPLTVAVSEGHLDMVQLLLRRGADPNRQAKIDNGHAPVLAHAIKWFHLGSGRHEIAELLVAAGADLTEEDLPKSVREDALRLASAVEMGAISRASAAEIITNIDSKNIVYREFRQQLLDGKVSIQPTLASARRLRREPVDSLVKTLGDKNLPIEQRAGASRVLSVRDFELTRDLRNNLLPAFESRLENNSVTIANLQRILKYRSIPSSKGGSSDFKLTSNSRERTLFSYGQKFAVVIGVSDYENLPQKDEINKIPRDLQFAEADAKKIVGILENGYMGNNWDIMDFLGMDAQKAKVDNALTLLSEQAGEKDLVLFFFSGHGFNEMPDGTGKNYFFLQNSQQAHLNKTALSFAKLRDWALSLQAKHVLLLLDACRSGTVGVAKGTLNAVDYDTLDDRRVRKAAGKIALTANIGNLEAYEWEDRRLGFFTATLVDVIEGKLATSEDGPYVTVQGLFNKVGPEVIRRSSNDKKANKQFPQLIMLDGDALLDFPIALVDKSS